MFSGPKPILHLDATPRQSFEPGSWLKGVVTLEVSDPQSIKSVDIILKGICDLYVSKQAVQDRNHKAKDIKKEKDVFHEKDVFLELAADTCSEGKEDQMSRGHATEIPFSLPIPTSCISSKQSKWTGRPIPSSTVLFFDRGSVRYELDAVVTRKALLNKSVKSKLQLEVHNYSQEENCRSEYGQTAFEVPVYGLDSKTMRARMKSIVGKTKPRELWYYRCKLSLNPSCLGQFLSEVASLYIEPTQSGGDLILDSFQVDLTTITNVETKGLSEVTRNCINLVCKKNIGRKIAYNDQSSLFETIILPTNLPVTQSGATFSVSHEIKVVIGVRPNSGVETAPKTIETTCKLHVASRAITHDSASPKPLERNYEPKDDKSLPPPSYEATTGA